MEVVFGCGGPVETAPGARLTVVLVDGVGCECQYTLHDVALPPPELKIQRPPHVPPLETVTRDPGFVYFRLRAADSLGVPFYDQITRD